MARKGTVKPKGNKLGRIITKVILWFFAITILWVLVYRFVNPPITLLMIQRGFESKTVEKKIRIDRNWITLDELSSNLKKAAIAGEDATFLSHNGFDFKAMETAFQKNKSGGAIRGGSTISQQTAKNVFLWPGRSYIRKGLEAYFTILLELIWGKERILEVYLNIIETGDGIYGVDAASRVYYGKSAQSLTKRQAAMLIAILPNPRKWSPVKPGRLLYRKQSHILRNMRRMDDLGF